MGRRKWTISSTIARSFAKYASQTLSLIITLTLSCSTGFISPTVMLPERRLATLLSQAQSYQQRHHAFPSSASEPFSLLVDAEAQSTETFPDHTSRILREHTDEVWRLAWSHSGDFLATAGKDRTVIIWNVKVRLSAFLILAAEPD